VPAAGLAHAAADALNEPDRAGDVGVDDVLHVVEVLVQEAVAQAVSRVGEERCHGSAFGGGKKRVHAVAGGEVRAHREHARVQHAQLRLGLDERLVGADQQVVALARRQQRELEADA